MVFSPTVLLFTGAVITCLPIIILFSLAFRRTSASLEITGTGDEAASESETRFSKIWSFVNYRPAKTHSSFRFWYLYLYEALQNYKNPFSLSLTLYLKIYYINKILYCLYIAYFAKLYNCFCDMHSFLVVVGGQYRYSSFFEITLAMI